MTTGADDHDGGSGQAAGEGQGDGGRSLSDRVGALEGKLDQILETLAGRQDNGGGPAAAQEGGSIGKEIRDQLDARDAARARAEADKQAGDRLRALEVSVSELQETPPVSPPTRRARIMGWS